MRRFAYVFAGIVLVAAAAGVLSYRLMNEPSGLERYSWLVGEENVGSPQRQSPQALPPSDGDGPSIQTQARRAEDAQSARERLNNMKLIELGLDVANVLVGVIGIYLTLSGMRMRRRAGV